MEITACKKGDFDLNILIISNSAPSYHRFFNGLGKSLVAAGHSVEIAVDCPYCRDLNGLDELGFKIYDFASYFSTANLDREILDRYRDFPLNGALLSDYERSDVYKIGRNRDTEYYLNLQSALLGFFEAIIDSAKTDVVIYESVSNAFAHYAWFACQKNNVAYYGLAASRLPGRFAIVRDPFAEHVSYQRKLQQIQCGEVIVSQDVYEWSRSYLENIETIVPDYVAYSKLDKLDLRNHYLNVAKLEKLKIALRHLGDDHRHAFQVGNPLKLAWKMVRRRLLRVLKLKFTDQHYSAASVGEDFILYPLHYHPESSTSIQSGTYLDEYEVVRNIAFSLPVGFKLYVKDHPSACGNPAPGFYRRVAALPNVRIISPHEDTKRLIKDSKAVITLTSTVGYEALLLNRRVFLFGSVFYQFHPNVVRIHDPSDLFRLLSQYLLRPILIDKRYNLEFVASYFLSTYPGILNFYLDADDSRALVKGVAPIVLGLLATERGASAPCG